MRQTENLYLVWVDHGWIDRDLQGWRLAGQYATYEEACQNAPSLAYGREYVVTKRLERGEILMTDKYLTKQDITLFFDVLKRRTIDLNQFDESDHLNRRLAEFHNETIGTVIAQFRRVVMEAGYPEEVEGGASV